jgi:hypothetical protein
MAYFNHAFSKAFLAKTHEQTNTQTSVDLTAVGEFAILASDFGVMNAADVANNKGGFYLAQAAFQTNDKIGNNPGMGGYKESSKSKMIMSKYISDMWISDCTDEVADIGRLTIKATADNQSCFPCDVQPMFRADIKGTAVLRFLNHNAYATLNGALPMAVTNAQDGSGALATSFTIGGTTYTYDPNNIDMCCGTQTAGSNVGIAPSIVAINLRDQFNNDPILSKFATATLEISSAGAAYAGITAAQEQNIYAGGALGVAAAAATPTTGATGVWADNDLYKVKFTMKTSCALQTQFGDASFDTRDFYLMGDLKTIVQMQDETGQACIPCLGYVTFTESATAFKQRRTSADTALRDILLTESYRQSPYTQGTRDASRMRQQEGMDGVITAVGRDATTSGAADCVGAYRVYHLIHNVPRFNNPSGVFNNDQYHYKVYVACSGAGAATTSIDADWVTLAIQAGVMKRDGSAVVSSVADLEAKGGDY